jgi:hypothetical protein
MMVSSKVFRWKYVTNRTLDAGQRMETYLVHGDVDKEWLLNWL